MAQPSFPRRNVYSSRIPDRTAPSSSQQPFGQTAPGYGRPPQHLQHTQHQQQQQPAYGYNPSYAPPTGFRTGRVQTQGPARGVDTGIEHENLDLTPESRDEINEAFNVFDVDKDGYLDIHEFRVALRALGFDVPLPEVVELITINGAPKPNAVRVVDTSGRTQSQFSPGQMRISQQAFTAVAAQKIQARDPMEEIERAFALFAGDKDFIDIEDLRRVATELGETSLEEQELQTMIDEFDYHNTGGISKQSFIDICLQ